MPEQEVSATNPPKLAVSDIPILPGRYIDLYNNLADTINAANAAPNHEEATVAINRLLSVKLNQVSIATRILRLIRESAKEGRILSYA